MKRGKKFELTHIISLLKEGKMAKQIAEELNISKSNLSYYLDKLKKKNLIKYKGHGIWLVQKSVPTRSTHCSSKKVRGHAFIWKIKLNKNINWKKYLDSSKIDYKLQSNNKVLRIFFLGKKIWLTQEGMIIYEPFDFWGSNSYESKGKAVFNLDRLIKNLFFKLRLPYISYKFDTSREHYAIVKNELARQYNDRGEKLYIKSDDGEGWMWIDYSHGINELETNNVSINKSLQDWWNDHRKNNFQVKPSFILESISEVTNNQLMFNKNFESHVNSIKELGNSANANAKSTELLADVILELQKEVKDLKSIIKRRHYN